MEVDVVSLAAEFPNDNPALHRGVTWVCLETTGPAVAIAAAPDVAFDDTSVPSLSVVELLAAEPSEPALPEERPSGIVGLGETPRDESVIELVADDVMLDDDEIVVEEMPPLDETVLVEGSESAPRTLTIAPPPCDEPWTVFVNTLADVAIGAGSPHAASSILALLLHGSCDGISPDAVPLLAQANIVCDGVVSPAFIAKTRAWRGILLGTSDDFAACGDAMLDEWSADLLARLLGGAARATALKRELRERGVAAFGLASAA